MREKREGATSAPEIQLSSLFMTKGPRKSGAFRTVADNILPGPLNPGLPVNNNLFIDQDPVFLNRAWNQIGRVVETPSLNSIS